MRKPWTLLVWALVWASPVWAQANRFEPNQTRRTAGRLTPGDYKGLNCNDEDWYFLEVPAGQRLAFELSFPHADGDLQLELYNVRGELVGWSRSDTDGEAASFTVSEDAQMFARVHGARANYDMVVGLSPAGVPGLGETLEATAAGRDWYSLEIEDDLELLATLGGPAGLTLAIYDGEGEELGRTSGEGPEQVLQATVRRTRQVLLEVAQGSAGKGAAYSLALQVGEPVPEDLASVFRTERPAGAGNDLVTLQNGEVLQGRVLNERYRVATPYADVELPAGRVAGLDVERRRTEIETLIAVDGSQFSGYLRTSTFRIKVERFDDPVEIPKEYVKTVVFGRRGAERRGIETHQHFNLTNGDHFSGRLHNGDWTMDLGYTFTPLNLEEVQELHVEGDGEALILYTDGRRSPARLNMETLQITLDLVPALEFELHAQRLDVMYPQSGAGPAGSSGGRLRFSFEGGLEPWSNQGNWNTNWQHFGDEGVDGSGCARVCGPNGSNYGDSADVSLTSPALRVGNYEQPQLKLHVKTRLERGPDYLIVQVSYDGGQSFQELQRLTGHNEWSEITLPLQRNAQEVVVRLQFHSDGSIVNEGAWVDEVEVVGGE